LSGDNTKPLPPAPSEHMENAFRCGGGIRFTCHCGRTHFEDRECAGDWDNSELEGLREAFHRDPDKTIACAYSVTYATINGREYVLGCPCNGLRVYEDFLWNHRRGIAEYLAARAVDQKAAAELDHALVGDLPNAVRGT
jgi:hypothetical protein